MKYVFVCNKTLHPHCSVTSSSVHMSNGQYAELRVPKITQKGSKQVNCPRVLQLIDNQVDNDFCLIFLQPFSMKELRKFQTQLP